MILKKLIKLLSFHCFNKKIESKGAETEFYCFDLEKGEDISKKIIDGISSSENK